MKKTQLLMAALALYCGSAAAMQPKEAPAKNDTIVMTTKPEMHCEKCEMRIKSNVRFVKGTKQIIASSKDKLVTIIYDAQKAKPADYIEAMKKIGFEAKVIKK